MDLIDSYIALMATGGPTYNDAEQASMEMLDHLGLTMDAVLNDLNYLCRVTDETLLNHLIARLTGDDSINRDNLEGDLTTMLVREMVKDHPSRLEAFRLLGQDDTGVLVQQALMIGVLMGAHYTRETIAEMNKLIDD